MVKDLSHLLSDESKGREPSPLKSAFKYYGKDDIVFLGGGLPMADYFPWEKITATSPAPPFADGIGAPPSVTGNATVTEVHKHKVEEFDIPLARSLQYGNTQGNAELTNFLRDHTEMIHHVPYKEWDVALTIGNTQSWEACIRTFCNPGDSILIEEFTFPSAVECARNLKVEFVPVKMDSYGIIPSALDELLSNWDSSKPIPKLLYTICTGQNPTGSSLDNQRRKEIYEIACKYDFIIIEDEPYYFLQMEQYESGKESSVKEQTHDEFLNSLVKSFISMDTEGRVLRLDSFSKVLAPGSRIGWIVGQAPLLERFIRLHEVSIQAPSGFSQSLVQGLLGRWGQSGYLDWLIALRKEYTIKRDFTIKTLEKFMPTEVVTWTPPIAGMFFTIEIDTSKHPDYEKLGKDALKVEEAIYEHGLKDGCLMIPGSWFKAPNVSDQSEHIFFRGTYAAVPLKDLGIGLERFANAIKEEFKL
ncbi:hypothetical protein CANINC_002534 [Pichia inconspicua]|uniref:aromatic-amino-acid transaminase n=1 Tax=Pichia inconspicua TaxID=52247 RepID=A0A4T0X114_9ASCO|nr:hypothetical protein CANINC_002534 [[Candida] inconspicua]